MKISKIWGTTTYRTTRFKLLIAAMITGVLSIVLAIITFYGDNTGNFTITTKSDNQRIGLSIAPVQNQERVVLRFDGMKNIGYIDYYVLVNRYLNEIRETNGRHQVDNAVGYTFYLQNNSQIGPVFEIEYTLNIIEADQTALESLRVLIIIDDNIMQYSKVGTSISNEFVSESLIARGRIYNLSEAKKVTLVFFYQLPELDPETGRPNIDRVDDGAKVKLNMGFEVID